MVVSRRWAAGDAKPAPEISGLPKSPIVLTPPYTRLNRVFSELTLEGFGVQLSQGERYARRNQAFGSTDHSSYNHKLGDCAFMTEPYIVQGMQRLPQWPWGLASVTSVLAIGLGLWLGSWLAVIPVGFIILAAWCLHTRIRCPQCSRRLRSRSVALDEHERKLQYFYDCPHCRITWDPDCITESD